jgi:hypothetical protein
MGVFHVGFQGVLPTPSAKDGGQAAPTRMHVISMIMIVFDGEFDAWFEKSPQPNQPPLVEVYGRTPTRQSLISHDHRYG